MPSLPLHLRRRRRPWRPASTGSAPSCGSRRPSPPAPRRRRGRRGRPPGRRADRRDLPLLTIDPAGSRDLDQALAIGARRSGQRVRYAIADVAALVAPGGAIDGEAAPAASRSTCPTGARRSTPRARRGRGEPAARRRAPRAPVDDRPRRGRRAVHVRLERAIVRSRRAIATRRRRRRSTGARGDPTLRLLREVGLRRLAREAARGGVSLTSPSRRWCAPATATTCATSAPAGGGLERADLPADRDRRGEDHGRRGPRPLPDAGPRRGARPGVAAPQRPGARRRLAGGLRLRGRRARARRPPPRATRPSRSGRPGSSTAPDTPPGGAPTGSRRCTRRSRRSTPMSRRRCGAWATATPTRWCSPLRGRRAARLALAGLPEIPGIMAETGGRARRRSGRR